MRTYPTDESDLKEAARLGAPTWMLDALKLNPSYPHWGNHEDYMCSKDSGWREAQELATVADLWPQDDWNELVHGYYFIDRDGESCEACGHSGYNPATSKIADDWYGNRDHRDRWNTKLTQDEVVALVEEGRLWDLTKGFRGHYDRETSQWMVWQDDKRVPYEGIPYIPTPEEVNTWAGGRGLGHDSINRMICVETRAKRLGVYGKCPTCDGHGYVYTEEKPRLALQMWMLHPRKGASRGVIVRNVNPEDMATVAAYFQTAMDRMIERMAGMAGRLALSTPTPSLNESVTPP